MAKRDRADEQWQKAYFDGLVRERIEVMRRKSHVELSECVDRSSIRQQVVHPDDGGEIVVTTDIEWDRDEGGDIRVMVDARFFDRSAISSDDFIMSPDGTFVDE